MALPLHARTHPDLDVPGCFGCRAASVRVAPSAAGNRMVAHQVGWAADVARDRDAYARLRQQGLQPPRVAGAAFREASATSVFDVERRPVAITGKDSMLP